MGLKPDHWIRKMALERRMIEPFVDGQVRDGVISYGLSSYGYDIRVADEFKIFQPEITAAKLSDVQCAYVAGMLDAQGEIGYEVLEASGRPGLALVFNGDDRRLLEGLRAMIGTGQLRESNDGGSGLVVSKAADVQYILSQVLPYLTCRRDAASRALAELKSSKSIVVDPKQFDADSFVDFKGEVCVIPANSFALGRTVEYFRVPRSALTICVGKCLTGDTRVVDGETGDYLSLEDLVTRRKKATVTLDGWSLQTSDVSDHVGHGFKPVYQLTTRLGLKIKATANHPFRTFQGWMPLADLGLGERIVVARTCPVFGQVDWPEHEATLLGLMLSDGHCHASGYSPRFSNSDPRLAEALTDAAKAFGCQVSSTGKYGYDLVNRRGRGGIMEKNRISAWLEQLECNVQSGDKFIPSVVFTARRERVRTFLQALFSGDGTVYQADQGFHLEYSTISERLAYDVRHLLLRFGIFALVRSKSTWTGGKTYWVQVTDRDMIRRFADEIGFLPGSRKQNALDDLATRLTPSHKSNFDTMPPAAWELMRNVAHASGRSLRSMGIKGTQPDQSLPYSIARQVAHTVNVPEFSALVDADVVWDTVKSIDPVGIEKVYDLTVPGAHNFLANDLIVHNSTYARCGIIVNVTPFEPEWTGYVTLEISNTTPLPAKIYADEGIAQVLFFEADEECEVSYADKKGKYQRQEDIVLPRL